MSTAFLDPNATLSRRNAMAAEGAWEGCRRWCEPRFADGCSVWLCEGGVAFNTCLPPSRPTECEIL